MAGHRTIYGAAPEEASYGESLASLRPSFTIDNAFLADYFDDVSPGDTTTVREAVEHDWRDRHHMEPGTIPAGWRQDRLIYRLRLPTRGWFVDIERAESIQAISRALRSELAALKLTALTVGDLRGENREITTRISEWLRAQVLDDGSLPHGIFFGSKHDSTWKCWAIWLRAVDDGKPIDSEPVSADAGNEILPCDKNVALNHVKNLFDLRCY